ncbi:hypothetical protein HYN48_01470 [Flavobacterium magnum]|uniref:Peptidase E n=1 Tax=Flavobacterium magnum TaxID=2162713 RepID=A0A2S0RDT1_9FLAO|nr:DUF6702 family protein [Flavobacterium magnum]AWA28862.1 hypothetical protein HYN48_01470 [Flavobacterium magnum]
MKKAATYLLIFVVLSGFSAHKFYVSIYQVHVAAEKKRIEITARIFMDDLNNAVGKHFNKKTHIGEKNEVPDDVELLRKYLAEKFVVRVNGQKKALTYLSKELEANVVICYFRIADVTKANQIDIYNAALMELNDTQQNIIQYSNGDEKQSLLLTAGNASGVFK